MVAPRYRHAIRISDVVSSSTSLEVPVVTRNSHSRSKRRIPVAATLARFLPALLIIVLWWSSSVFFHSPSPLLPSGEPLATRLDIHGGEAPLPSSLGYDTVQRVGPVADFTENEEIGRPTIERQTTKVLTIFMESPLTLDTTRKPLPIRKTFASKLRKVEFPNLVTNCAASIQQELPVDYFPESDPFLPWIHDYFVNQDASEVRFVAQNRRRCETGEGKEIVMRYWEPQVALMQAVPVKEESAADGTVSYRLASPDEATVPETRFLCHFHDDAGRSESSLSTFSFNYEYVLWRKRKLPMYQLTGPDVSKIELSQLLFQCPVPTFFRDAILTSSSVEAIVHLDVVPIRTPPRLNEQLFTADMIGEHEFAAHGFLFNASEHFGTKHVLPSIQDSGRWANLPICPPPAKITPEKRKKPYRLVACTWTAASYRRRGDVTVISDSVARLKEWIVFHKLVGVDHIYLYDNTQLNDELRTSPLQAIVQEFSDYVTYIPWPAIICSNNRPNFRNPGERSSQYAADAACRSKYGDLTEWMAFIDSDEYLVPMSKNQSWPDILQDMETQNVDVLKMRSSRGRPRHDYMEVTDDPAICVRRNRRMSRLQEEPCAVPRRNETFLRVFNCDYIRHPRPERFHRAMKQIYRPANVLSHFVHYSSVTSNIARYYKDTDGFESYKKAVTNNDFRDRFLNELTEGVLIHAKSVLPYETMTRTATCYHASKYTCIVGHACPNSTAFDDNIHQKNVFQDKNGEFCNCWVDAHVETFWIPLLEKALLAYS